MPEAFTIERFVGVDIYFLDPGVLKNKNLRKKQKKFDHTLTRDLLPPFRAKRKTESHKCPSHTLALGRRKKKKTLQLFVAILPCTYKIVKQQHEKKKANFFSPSVCNLLSIDRWLEPHRAPPLFTLKSSNEYIRAEGTYWECGSIYRLNCLFPHFFSCFLQTVLYFSCVCTFIILSFSNLWLL